MVKGNRHTLTWRTLAFLRWHWCAWLLITAPASGDVVHRRGDLPAIEGRIVQIDDGGLTVDVGAGDPQFVRWDLVRDVVTDEPNSIVDRYREDAENLWRARSRLERNDAALAEPLFERLFEKYRGQTNETAIVVAEGLLRCRLARGAHDAAVIPALETARLHRAIRHAPSAYASLSPVMDERTSLCTFLPPAWVTTPMLIKVERDLGAYNAGTDTVVAAFAVLYRRAAQQQLAIRVDESERVLAADHAGVALLRMMVELGSSDPARRTTMRAAALRGTASAPNWMQAWTYYFVGLSLMQESDPAQHNRGLVTLAYLPARFGVVQPHLTGLALAKIAEACDASGQLDAASSLRIELATRFPHHPVLASIKRKPAHIHDRNVELSKESS